jgi:4-amino-4-deoxy-L-arabinose transferase-like glycosyltransferase
MSKFLLPVFIVVNFIFYYFSYDGATFIEGADASQYYLPALSLLESGEFRFGEETLTFGPPLYSIFLAIPIGVFGLEGSSMAIVALQSLLLFFTGYLSKLTLLLFYSGHRRKFYSLLLHALIIFNPNSLITAHLIQSETLFTFILCAAVFMSFKVLNEFSLKNLILLGLFTGLATLVRPVGLYLLISWPVFLWVAIILKQTKIRKIKLVVPVLIGAMVISPWYVRNYIEFDELFYTSNSGAYLNAQYIQLKHRGSGWSRERANERYYSYFKQFIKQENSAEQEKLCLQHKRDWFCSKQISHTSLQLILIEPMSVHFKALIDSLATLFLSGGASNITNYLGIDGKKDIVNFQTLEFRGIESIKYFLNNIDLPYLLILIVTMLFTIVTRVIGIIGLFYMFKKHEWLPIGVLLVEIIVIFTASYLYLGQSRFRVPLEPILMLLVVIGVAFLVNRRQISST